MTSPVATQRYGRAIAGSLGFLAVVTGIGLAVYGRDIFVPIALAALISLLLNAMAMRLQEVRIGRFTAPRWLALIVSLLVLVAILVVVAQMVAATVSEMSTRAPAYQGNVEKILNGIKDGLGLGAVPSIGDLVDRIDFRTVATAAVNAISGLASNAGIIAVYVLFMLLEQKSFDAKLAALSKDGENRDRLEALFERIARETRTYIFLKTAYGALCAIIAWVVMAAVGLDFAVFWAFLTFVTYYIPTIGSLVAIALPTLLALVQFATPTEALIILVVSGGLQTVVANVLEPRSMGRSMNVSPFVMIVSLFVWGSIWGVAGMFLCVPLTVITMIVLSNFPRTWRIAVLLSSDGKLERPPGLEPATAGEGPHAAK